MTVVHRLGGRRVPVLSAGDADAGWSAMGKPAAAVFARLRVVRRLVLIVLWVLICFPVQALLVVLPGRANEVSARLFWRGLCAILGLRLRVLGEAAHRTADGRPIVYVATHSSWLDIPVLGARLDAAFIAKEEIAKWPVVSWIARLGRTVYVRRVRASTVRERDEMRARLAAGDSLILFPEGTTSDGSRVLPFRSAFLSVAELPVSPDGRSAIVQPVSLVYDRLGGMPVGRAHRLVFAWPGDMDLASHFLRFARLQGFRATILLHPPVDPAAYGSRKALSEAVWRIVADGAAALRQNRDPARNA
ncbi:MAG: lysophospholipid acyltransferase family protein [Alphaproteobacteria bacterium]|nr:lysophospholipid acyltransferase family protein [Alphaproteobacteria bacterium]